ncbi:MAG TPA: SsrA-binding protein SmpB [Clostridiales bacterium]|nr:SsrA-binding protein SmpB [Clostridiales bacterium]
MGKQNTGVKAVATNRRAHHEYFILETYEAGLALTGTEVKSLRQGKANLNDAFARVDHGECILYEMHISPYEFGNRFNPDPKRPRKLLLHKREILKLHSEIKEKGLTLIPLKIYFTRGIAKVELGLAKGKKLYDKRDDLAKKEADRKIDRAMKEFYK